MVSVKDEKPCQKELDRNGFNCWYRYSRKRCKKCIFFVPENITDRLRRKFNGFCRRWFK